MIVLDATRDGVQQISEALAGRQDIAAIHIVSHGAAMRLHLAASDLNTATVQSRSAELDAWQGLSSGADILVYSCDVAAGEQGAHFVGELARITRADVTSSTDATGSAAKGGDWVLEAATGKIDRLALCRQGAGGLCRVAGRANITDSGTARSTAEDNTLAITGITVGDADAGELPDRKHQRNGVIALKRPQTPRRCPATEPAPSALSPRQPTPRPR